MTEQKTTEKAEKDIRRMREMEKYLDERPQVTEEGSGLKTEATTSLWRKAATYTRRKVINELVRDHQEETDKLVEMMVGTYRSYRECCGQGDGSVKDLIEAISHQKLLVRQLETALSTAKEKLLEVKDLAGEVKVTGIESYLKNGE